MRNKLHQQSNTHINPYVRRLHLSHQIMGAVDDDVRQGYTTDWQELLGQHFRRLVEQGKGFREA